MKLLTKQLQVKANEIISSFKTNYQVLYLGQGITPEDLSREVCELPWACILTSLRDVDIITQYFSQENRRIIEHTEDTLSENPFQMDKLNVLRIYGIDDEKDDESDSFVEEFGMTENTSFLRNVAAQLDGIVKMHVIGYKAQNECEVPPRTFANFLRHTSGYKYIEFYGDKESDEKLHALARHMNCEVYEQTLAEILTYTTLRSNKVIEKLESDEYINTFYSNEEMYSIPTSELKLAYDDFCFLVTEESMQVIQPNGKASYTDFFLDFLEKSATEGPQWVGYQRRSQFYVERDYAQLLETVIRLKLMGNNRLPQRKEEGDLPIILSGASGSSKSVVFGALAYKFYQEHQYPVLFLRDRGNGDALNQDEISKVQRLVELLNNKTDNKVLILWDCSSHKYINQFYEMTRKLSSKGRRFVLVGSAYEYQTLDFSALSMDSERQKSVSVFKLIGKEDDRRFIPVRLDYCNPFETEGHFMFLDDSGYYIKADRDVSECELKCLKRVFREYSGISSKSLEKIFEWVRVQCNNDIFMYFYYLTTLLRPKLVGGLDNEHVMVGRYVQNRLNKIFSNMEGINLLMDTCHMDIDSLIEDSDDDNFDYEVYEKSEEEKALSVELDPKQEKNLDRFNTCIALFSQFKLSVPYSVAIRMFDLKEQNDVVYSTYDRKKELFLVLTQSIPWIWYGKNGEEADFSFRFRNPLEAELYLAGDSVGQSVEKLKDQLEIIVKLMEMYGKDYQNNGYENLDFKKSLLSLLKLIGPNTSFSEFKKGGKRYQAHLEMMASLEIIIDKLKELRKEWKIPDYDGGFAITEISFSREFYRQSWDKEVIGKESVERDAWENPLAQHIYSKEKYEVRLKNMKGSLEFALKKVEEIKALYSQNERALAAYGGKGQIRRTRNNLINEMVLGNIQAYNLLEKYIKYCNDIIKEKPDKMWVNGVFTQSYESIFKQMQMVISSDPGNGYYYNTLFKCFQQEYDNPQITLEKKLKYLAEISNIADMAESNTLINKGETGDDVDMRIAWIREKEGTVEVSMDEVYKNADTPFNRMLQVMLEKQNPAGLLFVCRNELKNENISILQQQEDLSKEEKEKSKKVLEFLLKSDYKACVFSNVATLLMLIRVMWMVYTGKTVACKKECQCITMKNEHWRQLQKVCNKYMDMAGDSAMPSVVLIYALATLQVTKDYKQCWEIIGRIRENNFLKEDRMRTPYIYCDELGEPYRYTGRVLDVDNPNAIVKVKDICFPGSERGIRMFVGWNNTKIKTGTVFDKYTNLELGIHYTGFKMYTKESRMAKVGKQ